MCFCVCRKRKFAYVFLFLTSFEGKKEALLLRGGPTEERVAALSKGWGVAYKMHSLLLRSLKRPHPCVCGRGGKNPQARNVGGGQKGEQREMRGCCVLREEGKAVATWFGCLCTKVGFVVKKGPQKAFGQSEGGKRRRSNAQSHRHAIKHQHANTCDAHLAPSSSSSRLRA